MMISMNHRTIRVLQTLLSMSMHITVLHGRIVCQSNASLVRNVIQLGQQERLEAYDGIGPGTVIS